MAKKGHTGGRPGKQSCPSCNRAGGRYVERKIVVRGKTQTTSSWEICKTCGGRGVIG